MIKKISFDEYEKLHEDKIYQNQKELFLEERGVNPHINEIAKFIIEYIDNNKPIEEFKNNDAIGKCYKIYIGKYFIDTLFLLYIIPLNKNIKKNYNGVLKIKKGFYVKDGRCSNAQINLVAQGCMREDMTALSHEIGHLYRYCQLLSKNQGQIPKGELKRLDKYRENLHQFFRSDDDLEKIVRELIYQMNKDEIHSQLEEMYSDILNNKHINRGNYMDYVKGSSIFELKERIKQECQNIDEYPINIKKDIGRIYSNNNSPMKGFKLFRNKLFFFYQYITDKMYNTISLALDKIENIDESRQTDNEFIWI